MIMIFANQTPISLLIIFHVVTKKTGRKQAKEITTVNQPFH